MRTELMDSPVNPAVQALIAEARDRLLIVSPWVKREGADLLAHLSPSVGRRGLLFRGLAEDLADGSSDIAAIEAFERAGFELYRLPHVHAKVILSEHDALVGSANLTGPGLLGWSLELVVRVRGAVRDDLEARITGWLNETTRLPEGWLAAAQVFLDSDAAEKRIKLKRELKKQAAKGVLRPPTALLRHLREPRRPGRLGRSGRATGEEGVARAQPTEAPSLDQRFIPRPDLESGPIADAHASLVSLNAIRRRLPDDAFLQAALAHLGRALVESPADDMRLFASVGAETGLSVSVIRRFAWCVGRRNASKGLPKRPAGKTRVDLLMPADSRNLLDLLPREMIALCTPMDAFFKEERLDPQRAPLWLVLYLNRPDDLPDEIWTAWQAALRHELSREYISGLRTQARLTHHAALLDWARLAADGQPLPW